MFLSMYVSTIVMFYKIFQDTHFCSLQKLAETYCFSAGVAQKVAAMIRNMDKWLPIFIICSVAVCVCVCVFLSASFSAAKPLPASDQSVFMILALLNWLMCHYHVAFAKLLEPGFEGAQCTLEIAPFWEIAHKWMAHEWIVTDSINSHKSHSHASSNDSVFIFFSAPSFPFSPSYSTVLLRSSLLVSGLYL